MYSPSIVSTRFSTRDLAAWEQFDAWHEGISALFDLERVLDRSAIGFDATVTAFQFGDIMLVVSDLEAQRYKRSKPRIRSDQIDHFVISLYQSGGWLCDGARGRAKGHAGQIHIVDLAQPLVGEATHSNAISMIVPRVALEHRVPGIESLHGSAMTGPYADLLADYIQLLARRLPYILSGDGVELANAACSMLVSCLSPSVHLGEESRTLHEANLIRRAKGYIEGMLQGPGLSPDSIALALGVSKRALYRAFETNGGIHRYIQSRRLERVKVVLVDQSPRRKISEIAADHGFARADHFSRAFKLHFGMSATDVRVTVAEK